MTPTRPEVEALLAGSTPGPWRVDESGRGVVAYADTIGAIEIVAWTARADARLLAQAPTLAADLLSAMAEVEELRAYGEGLGRERDEARDTVNRCMSAVRIDHATRQLAFAGDVPTYIGAHFDALIAEIEELRAQLAARDEIDTANAGMCADITDIMGGPDYAETHGTMPDLVDRVRALAAKEGAKC